MVRHRKYEAAPSSGKNSARPGDTGASLDERRNRINWFKHDTDATQDAKIRKLLIRHGAVGYAIYFHCLELIAAETSESNLTFELEHDSEIIADNLHIRGTADRSGIEIVQEIMRFIVETGLFQESDGRIFCFKLLKRLDASMTSNPQFRQMIVSAKENHDAVMISHDAVMIPSCQPDKPNKQEEKKEEAPSPSPRIPEEEVHRGDDATTRLERARALWNSLPLPTYRYLPVSMPAEQRGDALRTLGAYSDEEIAAAIRAYAEIKASPRHRLFPTYVSFLGFMRGGVESYCPDADPFERCKLPPRPGEYVDPDHDEKMEKAKKRAAELERPVVDEPEVPVDVAALIGGLTQKMTKGVKDVASNFT